MAEENSFPQLEIVSIGEGSFLHFFSLSLTPFFCIQSIEPWSCTRVSELSVLEQKYISEQYCLEQHVAKIVGNPEISLDL